MFQISLERMDSNGEHSFWPYGPSVWHDSYLLEDEALLCSLPFLSFGCQPLCSNSPAVAQSSSLQAPCLVPCDTGELDTSFDDDLLRCWEAIEQSDDSTEDSGKGLPLLCYGEESGAASNAMRADRVRSERVLTFELVSQYFYMPITQAARELNVGLTVLKKKCRELGIPRWPHRKLKNLQTLINDVEEAGKANDGEQLRAMVEMLEQERRLLEQRPYVELEEKTKRLRQACFKASYKKRRLLVLEPGEASKYY
nr:protein RKD4 isoform X2 [Aegilops tauschii subsp. strangulata]